MPAVLAWLACWGVFRVGNAQGLQPVTAFGLASALGVALSLWGHSWWRRLLIALGFPLSWVLLAPSLAGGILPAWGWLVPLAVVLLLYPIKAWRDAPLFPTPANALNELTRLAPLPADARVLDAGCGLGHGLSALRSAYPQAQLHGLEFSWLLRWWCALRCPWAKVRQGDIWRADWSTYQLVYLFQRPESMPHAVAKARAELKPGAWLVSLEFAALELKAQAHYRASGGKMVWLYRSPFTASSGE
jgi:SAM-dependent methyltransferase